MAATADIRFKRMKAEYETVRDAQDGILNRVDTYEAALLGLTEAVAENTRMLQAIIKHLQVPYEKPPMGFQKEERRPPPDFPA
ncbi:MAG: hypothetical protein OXG92_06790 [Chloroflexi bacterium]|nr:hypothetical protein [Chloroflexota bacterium]MCY3583551.1 hypothetical protein [Chloroflexota bacterium]MCY3716154.1 hypothetical protein [Chloroflexota bacterium]MDE2650972.1 hypothetical protein [Chloroflexota bacterium]MXV93585.1 hypothetical protein [Chloroflexota bacterium]